jgi:hypothetical protein
VGKEVAVIPGGLITALVIGISSSSYFISNNFQLNYCTLFVKKWRFYGIKDEG